MRILVFFDLPTLTAADKKAYRLFRKYLLKNGYLMLQESVYCRLCINKASAELAIKDLKKRAPKDGLIQSLLLTEKQFSNIEFITGQFSSNIVNSVNRVVIL